MTARAPLLSARIIASTTVPGELSIRIDASQRDGGAFRRALKAAGFKPGDRVVLTLAETDETTPPVGRGADWT